MYLCANALYLAYFPKSKFVRTTRGGWGLMMLQTVSQDVARLSGAFRALDQLKIRVQHVLKRKCAVSGLFLKIRIRPHD